jgi:hypothetical protein
VGAEEVKIEEEVGAEEVKLEEEVVVVVVELQPEADNPEYVRPSLRP